MELNFECNRLAKDELAYELRIRGFEDVGAVEEMRTCLRNVLKLEKSGQKLTYPSYALKSEDEFEIVEVKIVEIQNLIDNFSDEVNSGPYKKIISKIAHIVKRVDRIPYGDENTRKTRSKLLSKSLTLMPKLKNRIRVIQNQDASVLDLSLLNSELSDDESYDGDVNVTPDASKRKSVVTFQTTSTSAKSVPVYKWNLKFSGDDRKCSVASFLEKVERFRQARHVDKDELFQSAFDLFSGTAEKWFSANCTRFNSWDELAFGLKKQFQPPDYDDRLFEEIKRRTQGDDENIGIFVANMKNFFSRLTCNAPESTQLKIIMKNLNPYYQLHLGLVDVNSIDHLVELCTKLEIKKQNVENFNKPLRRKNDLEPDLAYVSVDSSVPSHSRDDKCATVNVVKCWNCQQSGHKSKFCRKPPKKHCFKCGEPNVTVHTCRNCKGSNVPGN